MSTSSTTHAVVPVQKQLMDSILAMIADGAFKPGDRLQEEPLAVSLGVSRTPIRQALLALVGRGLLVSRPNKGVYIPPLDVKSLLQLAEVRIALEVWTMELLASSGPSSKVILGSEFNAGTDGHDSDFHRALVRAARNDELVKAWEMVNERLLFARRLSGARPLRAQEALLEHEQILSSISHGRIREAQDVLVTHIRGGIEDFVETLGSREDQTTC